MIKVSKGFVYNIGQCTNPNLGQQRQLKREEREEKSFTGLLDIYERVIFKINIYFEQTSWMNTNNYCFQCQSGLKLAFVQVRERGHKNQLVSSS